MFSGELVGGFWCSIFMEKDKQGHEIFDGKPIHKSDNKRTEFIIKNKVLGDIIYEKSHCIFCGIEMSRPKKMSKESCI